ncbi:hypothetical protein HMPREF1548_05887 [Clostridium sp. KLE 1755]|nr:hypothetical protein HMPREF1548_05887 [Clostridium sp. KLE 1755]
MDCSERNGLNRQDKRISAGNVLPAVRATAAGSRYKAHSTA